MIPMKLGWLLLEGILVGFFLHQGSSEALALAVVLILLPLISILLHLYVRKRLTVSFSNEANLRKKENGEFTLTLVNPTMVPVLQVACQVHVENQLNRQTQKIPLRTWLPPRKSQTITVHLSSDYCGRMRVSLSKVKLYDCFGLVGIACRVNGAGHLTVQPDTFEPSMHLLPLAANAEDQEIYSQERSGADLTETFQIREYVPGDSMRQIHWKLSSKLDRLIVREPALPIARNVLVFWERTGQSPDPEMIDAQAEVIVSVCKGLLDQSIQFSVGWNDTDRNLCILHEIHSMDDLVGIVPRLMRATGAETGISGAELLLQTRAQALCAHMIYLAEEPQQGITELEQYGHVTMLLCGEATPEGALKFDPQNYQEQLSQIDL